MKIRNGFVSNSSSASFMIKIEDLTQEQIESIKNYEQSAYYKNSQYPQPCWRIIVTTPPVLMIPGLSDITWTEGQVLGFADIDNFDIYHYMTDALKIDPKMISYEDDNGTYIDDEEEEI